MQSLRFIAASKNAAARSSSLTAMQRSKLLPPTRLHFARRCWMSDDSATSNNTSDRIHSTDIAFKPAESGWGATKKYESNFDRIFGAKTTKSSNTTTSSSTTTNAAITTATSTNRQS